MPLDETLTEWRRAQDRIIAARALADSRFDVAVRTLTFTAAGALTLGVGAVLNQSAGGRLDDTDLSRLAVAFLTLFVVVVAGTVSLVALSISSAVHADAMERDLEKSGSGADLFRKRDGWVFFGNSLATIALGTFITAFIALAIAVAGFTTSTEEPVPAPGAGHHEATRGHQPNE